MKAAKNIPSKILSKAELLPFLNRTKLLGKSIVFTNGVFDILHKGHLKVLSEAAVYGDILVVGINADTSVKRLKGDKRPITDQESRALIIASLVMVDVVIIFEEDTPLKLIQIIKPDVLVKGGDYTKESIVGADVVEDNNGRVIIISTEEGFSTTNIIDQMKKT
jgi:D-beta-D-heptose 7-phosphate kinase/D-beta-D-heptose 1-phosphate adenosyltransferase